MKRVISVLAIVCIILSFTGCKKKAYEEKAKEFTSEGFTITLTESFEKEEHVGYFTSYVASDVAVLILKETDKAEDFNAETLENYAERVYQANVSKSPTNVTQADGLTYIEYEFVDELSNNGYRYLVAMYKGSDAFWIVQFSCEASLYIEYRPYFLNWAKTVNVSLNSTDNNVGEQI